MTVMAERLKGARSPAEVREKAKEDLEFRDRLIAFVARVVKESLPEETIDEVNPESGYRIFQPMLHPDDPHFYEKVEIDQYDIARSRNTHKHTQSCFKYGHSRCRARFPRQLVPETRFNEETGTVEIERNNVWLNGYNPTLAIMTRVNHDVQFITTKNHALAAMYYINKYISKQETSTYSKLTIASAVTKDLANESLGTDVDFAMKVLHKTYNKLDSHREIGVPEAISHLLKLPDHLTNATFVTLHTTHLLRYLNQQSKRRPIDGKIEPVPLDAAIIHSPTFSIVSPFDDYVHRGAALAPFCLYDYRSLVYKDGRKKNGGIRFSENHPQSQNQRQFVRLDTAAIPTLLGRLLFIQPTSDDETQRQEYYCLVSALFIPWSWQHPLNPTNLPWDIFYEANKSQIPPRLMRHIENLALLHKSKEESMLDALHRRLQDDEGDDNHNVWGDEDDQNCDEISNESIIDNLISNMNQIDNDLYTAEAVDANWDAGYITSPLDTELRSCKMGYSTISLDDMKPYISPTPRMQGMSPMEVNSETKTDHEPEVYLTDTASDEMAVIQIIRDFKLNSEQALSFRIITDHAMKRSPFGDQLLMGVFGEGGTGKSRLIEAVQAWFQMTKCEDQLIVTALTGTAAQRLPDATTLHSAVGIPVETGDHSTMVKVSQTKRADWRCKRYLIIDEVSMMDCKIMQRLNSQLSKIKNRHGKFGNVNIIFLGDFLQLPSVSNFDLYVDNNKFKLGHDLWRSLNAVTILRKQMRQAGDQRWAELLGRLRHHCPTDEDIRLLMSRIETPIPDSVLAPVVVRRHKARHGINNRKLKEISESTGIPITYCFAKVLDPKGMSMQQIYRIKQGDHKAQGDAILALLLEVPLMVTKNVNHTLGMIFLSKLGLTLHRTRERCNGSILRIR